MKVRISNKNFQEYPAIAKVVHDTKKRFCDIPKSFNYVLVKSDHRFYIGEGDYYHGIMGDKEYSFQTVSNDTLGASGLSHKIGESFFMPSGSFLINVSYYQTYHMTVYQVI